MWVQRLWGRTFPLSTCSSFRPGGSSWMREEIDGDDEDGVMKAGWMSTMTCGCSHNVRHVHLVEYKYTLQNGPIWHRPRLLLPLGSHLL